MRLLPAAILGAGLSLAGCLAPELPVSPEHAQSSVTSPPQSPNAYIVVYKPSVQDTRAEIAQHVDPRGAAVRHVYQHALRGWAGTLSAGELQRLRNDPHVDYIEPDGVVSIGGTQTPTPSWGLDRIDQRNLPLNTSFAYNRTGAGVRLYSLDTGILYSHSDFGGRASAGYDAVTVGGGAVDCHGHGTHTSSTAAGSTYGVAKGMTIIGIRVLGCSGSGPTSGVIAGVDWVTQHAVKPAVANMSLGGGISSALDQSVSNSIASGVVYAVSSGNSNADACNYSPARVASALTVNASDGADGRASFSNYGSCTDLFAPGVAITAAWIGSNSAITTISGTSMAAPHVAGAAGLYLEANPSHTPSQVGSALLSNATTSVIGNAGTGSPNRLLYTSFIPASGGGGTTPNQPPVASPVATCVSMTCTFDGTRSRDDGGIVAYEWRPGSSNVIATQPVWSMTFKAGKTRTWTLTVRDAGGLEHTQSFTFTVPGGAPPPAPVASFTASCVLLVCSFDASSTTAQTSATYSWAWGDGSANGSGVQATHTYGSPGAYTVTLSVTDAGGTSLKTQTVNPTIPAPVAAFSFSCTVLLCGFDASSSTAQPNATYSWQWGDGTPTGSGVFPTHSYGVAGSYNVTLTVSDAGGTSSKLQVVTVTSAPSANQPPVAIPLVNCSGMTCSFDGRSSTDDAGIVAYEWYPGGPTPVSTQPFWSMTFSAGRTRTWTLTVRDGGGLSSSTSFTFTVPTP